MSSNLLKAFNVIAQNDRKVVGVPSQRLIVEETDAPMIQEDQEKEKWVQEIAKQKEKAERELAEWRQREEEKFKTSLEAEKRRGYEEGYQLGFQDGTKHSEELCQDKLKKSEEVLEQAYLEKQEIIREAEPFVIELTMGIAKKVLQQELKTHPDTLIELIKQSLSTVYETESLSIGVSLDDYSFVQKQKEQLKAVLNGQLEIKLFPDYSVEAGGCIIRTSSGSIDARIDVQLSEIKKVLLSIKQEQEVSDG